MPEQLAIDEEEERNQFDRVHAALATLTLREQQIIEARILRDEKATLSELAETFGVSLERIRQIETAALKKLKAHLSVLSA